MDGEIQEPLHFNFKADLLQSGSISFGRFESESLSWERRSSFSHNRYLEEVEKYSKPGSVTEKKAYFEAHFRRKALSKQSSSESQTVDNDDPQDLQDLENDNDVKHYTCSENDVLVNSEVHVNSESVNSQSQRKFPSKVKPASETKQPKPKSKAQTSFPRGQRILPGEAPNASAKSKTSESKGLLIKEKEKRSPRPATPIAHSVRKTPKPEESSTSFPKVKILPPSKSIVKEYRSEKTMETKSTVTEKSLPGARQTVNRRSKHPVITSCKPQVNQSAEGFTYRSDRLADERKEERRAAEITQSRKSLNFKATPMPSFYKESSRCSDQMKVNRPRTATMSPHTNRYLSNSATSSTPRPSSATSFTNRNHPSESSRRVQEKKKDSSSQKLKEPESTKGPRARDTLRRTSPRLDYLGVSVAT